MKTAILFGTLLIGTMSMAQVNNPYWVVETNPNLNNSIVRFYDHENLLLEEFTVKNKLLSVTRSNHKRFLNRKLRAVKNTHTLASVKK